jgi:DNA-binding MarR family transcriptional regulator
MNRNATELIGEVRLLHNRLAHLVEQLHVDTGITAPQRAVLEYLHGHGATTIPNIARARGVTRQHIQGIANELQGQELVAPRDNPAHQRSPLFALTGEGRRMIDGILARERSYLDARMGDIDESELAAATRVLADLRVRLTEAGKP